VSKSLVHEEERDGEARYSLLESIRQYGEEKLRGSEDQSRCRDRHRDWFLALAEAAGGEVHGPEAALWLARLDMEADNLRLAMTWRSPSEGGEAALRLAVALECFWLTRGYLSEGYERLLDALQRTPDAPPALRAPALHSQGLLAARKGDNAAARALHGESLALFRAIGDREGIARSLNGVGNVALSEDDHAAARAAFEESLAISRDVDDPQGIAASLDDLALVALNEGNHSAAGRYLKESLDLRRQMGDRQGIASALATLAVVARCEGDDDARRRLLEESLTLCRQIGDRRGIARSLRGLGWLEAAEGRYAAARTHFEECVAICRRTEDPWGTSVSLDNLGLVAFLQRDYPAARRNQAESLAIRRRIGDRHGIAYSLEALAALEAAEGATRASEGEPGALRAARLWSAAEALREEIGSPMPPSERVEYDRQLREARAAVGEAGFAAAWAEGRALTLEEAISRALDEEAERSAWLRNDTAHPTPRGAGDRTLTPVQGAASGPPA
jgi:tetratricopeptide (TPR) repeat protein